MVGNYKVITLCGSTKFKEDFMNVQRKLTLEGHIVISVGCFGHAGDREVSIRLITESFHRLKRLKVRYVEGVLMAFFAILVLPRAMLPESLHYVWLVLIVLCVTVFRCQFPSHLTIDHVTTALHRHATALEVFRAAVLLLILALSVCAHRNNSH